MTERLGACVAAALAAVALNSTAALVQSGATKRVRARTALDFGLLADLARRPTWLLGTCAAVVAFLFQATALLFGPLVLVQPILVTSLLVTVVLRALWIRRRPQTSTVVGAAMCAGGLSLFLALSRAEGGAGVITAADALPMAPVLAGVLGICLAVAARRRGNARAVALAFAAGILYGVTAGLTKVVTRQLGESYLEPTVHWELYTGIACAIVGVQLNQAAFQAGTVPAAVAVITVVDPITSVAIGLVWLGEQVNGMVPSLAFEAFGFGAMIVGIALLARETPEPVRVRPHSTTVVPETR